MKKIFRRLMEPILAWQVGRLVRRHHPIIIGVAGSVGKTSTRLAIASVLRQKYGDKLLDGRHNYNSEIGLPLAIFTQDVPSQIANPISWLRILMRNEGLIRNYPYECIILEMSTDGPGDIPYFMRWLHPEIGVVTAISPEHMENFIDLDQVAEEEFALIRGSKQAVLNDASPHLHQLAEKYGIDAVWYQQADADWPSHIRQALGAAVAVGAKLGVSEAKIKSGIADFEGAPGRMQRLKGVKDTIIIDDTYNSSPEAVKAALETLKELPAKRKIAVLGQMNELGERSNEYHQEVGQMVGWVDLLLTIGQTSNDYTGPASNLTKDERWFSFTSPYDAGRWLQSHLQPGDVVLVKGSQNGVFAEEAVKQILANPTDSTRLVRQSPEWIMRKHKAFGVE